MKGGRRESERDRHTQRQTDTQTDTQTDKQTKADRQTNSERQKDRQREKRHILRLESFKVSPYIGVVSHLLADPTPQDIVLSKQPPLLTHLHDDEFSKGKKYPQGLSSSHHGTVAQLPHIQVAEDDKGNFAWDLHVEERNGVDFILQTERNRNGQ